jgi:hypothetical protein
MTATVEEVFSQRVVLDDMSTQNKYDLREDLRRVFYFEFFILNFFTCFPVLNEFL